MRRPEVLTGIIAATVGLLGWLYALFGPTGQVVEVQSSADGNTVQTATRWTSLWREEDFGPVLVTFLLVMLLSIIGVLVGSVLRGRGHPDLGRVTLWVSAVVLLVGTLLSAFSIGLFFVPAAGLSLIAAILANKARGRLQDNAVS